MDILVLNGSPKGDISVTMQYVEYLKVKNPGVGFEIINIAERLLKVEKDTETFNGIIAKVKASSAVLWAFPLYHLLVHSNLKRFIELVDERGAAGAFSTKYTGVLATSIHYSDHTALNYVEAIAGDWGMRFVDFHSAEMNDILEPKKRKQLELFFSNFIHTVQTKGPTRRRIPAITHSSLAYSPSRAGKKVETEKRVTIITDRFDPESNIGKMILQFQAQFETPPELGVLADAKVAGACLGCCQCGPDNLCAYEGKDGFRGFWEKYVLTSDAVIIAGAMKDRYFSHELKRMFDRSFYLTHQPVFHGKQMGFLVSGPLSQEANFRSILEFYPDTEEANLAGIVCDESNDSAAIDLEIAALAEKTARFAEQGYVRPSTFLGVGGRKVFRDEIYIGLKLVFQKDYHYFKKHGLFDFPHSRHGQKALVNSAWPLMQQGPIKKWFSKEIKRGMVAPLQAVVEKAKKGK